MIGAAAVEWECYLVEIWGLTDDDSVTVAAAIIIIHLQKIFTIPSYKNISVLCTVTE